MNSFNIVDLSKYLSRKKLEWTLVFLSSTLLGIWAVKETIALRNILLFSGAILSIFYLILEWKEKNFRECITNKKLFPIILIVLSFIWVIFHYIFFSLDPSNQFEELKSTWLRALLASVIGFATGLCLRYQPYRLNLLWLGILIAFLVLFYQYINRALENNSLLAQDYDFYLFHLKFNTVLMGMILIAGITGAFLDYLHTIKYSWKNFKFKYLFFWLFSICLVLWTYVYAFNTRNGIGLSVIFFIFWFFYAIQYFISSQLRRRNLNSFLALLLATLSMGLILFFSYLQININKSWYTLFEDVKIAVQIDRYPNWQNPHKMDYPERKDGQRVAINTYERVAWAIAGTRAILAYPKGVGVLAYPFAKHPEAPPKMEITTNYPGIATHSGWVELGLAFGMPILGFIFTALLMVFIMAVRHTYPAKMTTIGLAIVIFCSYSMLEATTQHGIEILYYLLSLLSGFIIMKIKAS